MTRLQDKRLNRQRGFTLMEVLVTVLVLSIGLLGLASLQAHGMRNNNSAYKRTEAVLLVNDMADRIRANPTAAAAGDYNTLNAAAVSDPGCSPCNPDDMAHRDIAQWYNRLTNLPGGNGRITGDGSTFTVTVFWDDRLRGITPDHSSGAGLGCNPDNLDDLICFRATFVL